MRSSIRVFAVAVLVFFMMTAAFADDAASPAKKPADTAAAAPGTPDTSSTPAQPAAQPATPALTPAPPASSSGFRSDNTPMIEIFGGAAAIRTNFQRGFWVPPCAVAPCNPFNVSNGPFNMLGATGAATWNLRDWLGLTADFSYLNVRELNPGVSAHDALILFGPTFSSHKSERWTPFGHVLFGSSHLSGDRTGFASIHQNAFTLAMGLGADYSINRHIAWRIVQADYLITKFNDGAPVGSGKDRQDGIRLAGGFVFRFGYPSKVTVTAPPPNQPPVASCSANPNMVTAGSGDTVIVRANASDPDNDPLTFAWSASGGNVAGSGSEVRWNSAGVAPGTYTVTASVSDGHSHSVNCSADITVNPPPNHPPTVSCSVSRDSVVSGEPVTITATGRDPDGDPLTYSWATSAGRINPSGASARLDTTNVQGAATVTATVDDGRGGTASCSSSVDVRPRSLTLRSVYFVVNLPTKQHPEKGLLASQQQTLQTVARDFKSYLTVKPDARLMLEGYCDVRGGDEFNQALSERRTSGAKNYLVSLGVPAANIDTKGHGKGDQLSQVQVADLTNKNPELSAEEKARTLRKANIRIIWMAANRRVDVTLESTGQTSVQEFPFNSVDALTLIGGREKPKPAPKAPVRKGTKGTKKATTKKATKK